MRVPEDGNNPNNGINPIPVRTKIRCLYLNRNLTTIK